MRIYHEAEKGQYRTETKRGIYTPLQLANAMVSLFARERIGTVLEPSCGDGVFLDSLVQLDMLARVDALTAVEIEPEEAEKVRTSYRGQNNVKVYTEDFFKYYGRLQKYNGECLRANKWKEKCRDCGEGSGSSFKST